MRNSIVAIAAISSVAVLVLFGQAGCHRPWTSSTCWPTQGRHAGEAQAMRGQAIDYSAGLECSGDDLDAFTAALEEGYRAGQQRYCDPQRIWSAARDDGSMGMPAGFQPVQYAICADVPALQAAYDKGHEDGVDLRCLPIVHERVGSSDGAEGLVARFDPALFPMCGDVRLQAMAAAYARGHQSGLAGFCAPEAWEAQGLRAGNEGDSPADVSGSLAACAAEQRAVIVSQYERGYQTGLARFCAPESWEPRAHELGAGGRRAPDVGSSIARCSAHQQNGIHFHVRRGYELGLRTYCDGSGIVNAAREAARDGSEPTLPDAYVVCLDVFPDTQMIFASGYQTELTWIQQRWGSTPPMLPARFRELLQRVQDQPFTSDRLIQMQEAARYSHFTSEQVVALMQQLLSDAEKIEAAVALYPVVIDRESWFQVSASLGSMYSRDALAERIAALP